MREPFHDRLLRLWRRGGLAAMRRRLKSEARLAWLRLRHPNQVPSAYGVQFAPRWNDATFRAYLLGNYGPFLAEYLASTQDPFVFLDIGANQGLYTVLAARNPACAHVYAFEPVANTADALAENLSLNGVGDRATLIRKAISDRVGTVDIPYSEAHSGRTSLRDVDEDDRADETLTIETIDAEALAALVDTRGLPVFVKIDVEGHEAVVIDQLAACPFIADVTAVFYEVDTRWVRPAELRRKLSEAGFDQFEKIGGGRHFDVLASRSAAEA